ncbi:TPA: hypothetical protein SMQ11_003800 [Proteus mirabilis]|nr:hypothetical protein [Morganella morganii]HEK1015505.1 hypothetical protein [Proteus mirabilis]HEK1946704.1 hypothetical protein [Proteus mirabilis]
MFIVYMLSPDNDKGMEREKEMLGRATERYLNINGRWSGFPPKRANKLLYWLSLEEANQSADLARNYRKKEISVTKIGFSNKRIMERLELFDTQYISCLKGIKNTREILL